MITLESTVDEVDVDTLQTKVNARNSFQVSILYNQKFVINHNYNRYIYLFFFFNRL